MVERVKTRPHHRSLMSAPEPVVLQPVILRHFVRANSASTGGRRIVSRRVRDARRRRAHDLGRHTGTGRGQTLQTAAVVRLVRATPRAVVRGATRPCRSMTASYFRYHWSTRRRSPRTPMSRTLALQRRRATFLEIDVGERKKRDPDEIRQGLGRVCRFSKRDEDRQPDDSKCQWQIKNEYFLRLLKFFLVARPTLLPGRRPVANAGIK
jgi:hypothetical protein